ncbi:MAG: DNA polymerase III subunit delta [Candidatus Magasanikbacteria bacterium]|nr:DNA polymerase III subunit delta [Candidatus Magasanikbacteria bacterium]NCS72040.1 DNA polymerase III subunit delta [Candidatus Magasanikbacteria bacterium]
MIIFLHGKDTYRSKQHRKKLVAKFVRERDLQKFNTTIIDCEKEDSHTILEQVIAFPFLSEKRMIVLEQLLASKHKELQKTVLEKIKNNALPEENIVIFWEKEGKYKTKLAKELFAQLQKEQYAQEFAELSGTRLAQWISQEVTQNNANIDVRATQYLAQNIGANTWQMATVLAQLSAYADDKPITEEMVKLFIEKKEDDNIFNLVDAILSKQHQQVFAMITEQYKSGKDAQYIFAMIVRQIKIHTQIKDLIDRTGETQHSSIAKQLGIHPFVVKKTLPQLNRYTMKTLINIYQELLRFDTKVKTGQGDAQTLLSIFVGRHCI